MTSGRATQFFCWVQSNYSRSLEVIDLANKFFSLRFAQCLTTLVLQVQAEEGIL